MSLKLSTFLWREQQAEETKPAIWNVVLPIGEGFKEWDWWCKFVWNWISKFQKDLQAGTAKKPWVIYYVLILIRKTNRKQLKVTEIIEQIAEQDMLQEITF